MQLTPNTELQNGKDRIIRVLGQGGFGITYLAENILLTKFIAIKEFFPKDFCGRINTSHLAIGTQNNAETVAKLKDHFLKEARNIAKLDHPGIVRILDIFEENNTAYYVMDYINGENLNDIVKSKGPLSEANAVGYIKKVGVALAYIHAKNMTHFDIKPANIVVRKSDNMPILIDFGLSKQYTSAGEATSTMLQGVSRGYSPIELYDSSSLETFSPQTDIYSLGATLYFLITGNIPPSASELLRNKLQFPQNISTNNKEAIRKAMFYSRSKRQSSISAFTNQLQATSKLSRLWDTLKKKNLRISNDNWHYWLGLLMFITIILVINALNTSLLTKKDLPKSTVEMIGELEGQVIDTIITPPNPEPEPMPIVEPITEVRDLFWQSPLGIASYTGKIISINSEEEEKIPNGRGIAKISEGQYKGCVYNGDFVNGIMEGEAIYTQPNGDIFEGNFKNNTYEYGMYTIKSPGEYFEGLFDDNGQPSTGSWYDKNGNKLKS